MTPFAYFVAAVLIFQSTAPPTIPKDLSIKLAYGCPGQWIDTAAGTFSTQIDADTIATAKVFLADADRARLARAVDEARFFELPATVAPLAHPDGTITITSGHGGATRLEIYMRGRTHAVSHEPSVQGAETPELGRFFALTKAIITMFRARPEVSKLPPPQIFCL